MIAQGPGAGRAATPIVDHQVAQRPLDEVAKPASRGMSPVKIAAEEPDGEVLLQLLGRVDVAERRQEVAADRPGVAIEQDDLGDRDLLGRALVRLKDQGPLG